MEIQNVDIENFDEEVLVFMANKYSSDVRVLEGQLNRLIYFSIFENASRITMNLALEAFKDDSKVTITTTGKLTADKIKKTVAEYYNLSLAQLVSKSRMSNIAMARHILYVSDPRPLKYVLYKNRGGIWRQRSFDRHDRLR